jgi:hypothetical protein
MTESISEFHTVFFNNHFSKAYFIRYSFIIDIFYPSGELISLQSLHCSLFEVVHYIFKGHCFAFAAISVRE